jgi:hypothetical protein
MCAVTKGTAELQQVVVCSIQPAPTQHDCAVAAASLLSSRTTCAKQHTPGQPPGQPLLNTCVCAAGRLRPTCTRSQATQEEAAASICTASPSNYGSSSRGRSSNYHHRCSSSRCRHRCSPSGPWFPLTCARGVCRGSGAARGPHAEGCTCYNLHSSSSSGGWNVCAGGECTGAGAAEGPLVPTPSPCRS